MGEGRGRGPSAGGSTAARGTLEDLRGPLSCFFDPMLLVSLLDESAGREWREGTGEGGTKRERRKVVGDASEVHETR